jgi:hypothetical protein
MPNRVFVILRLAMLLGAAVVAGGCDTHTPAPIQPSAADFSAISAAHQQIRERTQRRFAEASFLSPQPESDAGIPLWMAPLLVHEYSLSAEDDARWARFGAVSVAATGHATVDDQRPTVYLSAADVMIGSQFLKQMTCLWFYPPPSAADQRIPYRGFRMTLGSRGYAVVWDMLSSESTERTMFVAKPVEQAAVGQFGGPLPGRQFAVEPPLAEHPEVVVPRVVGDGPQPMGPFVYLDAASLSVSTVICRCEPSQVDEFPYSGHYLLQRVGDLDEVFGGAPAPSNLSLPRAHVSPEGVLRLPAEL